MLIPILWNPITWIMETVIAPLIGLLVQALMPVFEALLPIVGDLIMAAFADIFFDIFCVLLAIVNFFSNAFFVFAGVYNVIENPGMATQNETFMLQFFINQPRINTIYWSLTLISGVLCVLFTIVRVLGSMGSMDYDPSKSVMKILGACGKTMIVFLLIPSMMIFGIDLATIVGGQLVQSESVFGYDVGMSIDKLIFVTSTFNASKSSSQNGANAKITDSLRKPYANGEKEYDAYSSSSIVSRRRRAAAADFDLAKIDFVQGYILAVFMIFILLGAALFAVRRLLEVLLLYLAAPFFVAAMPLDDGKRFAQWRDMFIAKLVSVYALALMMVVYLVLVPQMVSADLRLDANGSVDSLLKVVLMMGGAMAVRRSHSLLLQILSPQAAQDAESSVGVGFATGAMAAGAALKGMSMANRGVSGLMNRFSQNKGSQRQGVNGEAQSAQKQGGNHFGGGNKPAQGK